MTNIIFLTVLVLLAAYDVKTHRLPNVVMIPMIAISCLVTGMWIAPLIGFFVYSAFQILPAYLRLLGKKSHKKFRYYAPRIAKGDVKLAALLGASFGYVGILCMAVGIFLAFVIRFLTREHRPMAFTPFATLAIAICLLSDQALRAIVR